MKISIGMFAYNEAARIGETIRAVFAQTLVCKMPERVQLVELVVVPNGCKDDTAGVSRRVIAEELAKLSDDVRGRVSARVEELGEPGKSNAWNQFVHRLSDRSADAVLMLDSDIAFNHEYCFVMLLEKLEKSPEAWCVVGRPLKDIALKKDKSIVDRISLLGSASTATGPATIAGSMYLIRGAIVRRIWMPVGLLTEDGFLRAMLITEFFSNKTERPDRIVREERASQIFEAVKNPSGLFKHARRLLVGARINACVYDRLWNLPEGEDAGDWAERQQRANPNWLKELVRERIAGKGWWVMQRGLLMDRFHRVLRKPMPRKLAHLPVAIAAFPFDLAVLLSANRAVRRGEFRW
jgi:hypothetical protein